MSQFIFLFAFHSCILYVIHSQVGEERYSLQPGPANHSASSLPGRCATYQSGVQVSVVRGGNIGRQPSQPLPPPPRHPVFSVSLIFLEPFQELVENPVDTNGVTFELNSHLVTIALEVNEDMGKLVAVELTTDGRLSARKPPKAAAAMSRRFQPADTLALDGSFLFSLEFSFLNGSFNHTERRVACGEVVPPLAVSPVGGSDRGEDNVPPLLQPSPHCQLVLGNVTERGVVRPRCVCNRTGTYGLILPALQRWEAGVPVHGVSKVHCPGLRRIQGTVYRSTAYPRYSH